MLPDIWVPRFSIGAAPGDKKTNGPREKAIGVLKFEKLESVHGNRRGAGFTGADADRLFHC
jgi:hypothetical protein